MRTRVQIMTKREALQYVPKRPGYYQRGGRVLDRRFLASRGYLVEQAVKTAASELLGNVAEYIGFMRDGSLYAAPPASRRQGQVGQRMRLVEVSRRYVTLETL